MEYSGLLSHFDENIHPHMKLMFIEMQKMKNNFDEQLDNFKEKLEVFEVNRKDQKNMLNEMQKDLYNTKEKLKYAEEKIAKLNNNKLESIGKLLLGENNNLNCPVWCIFLVYFFTIFQKGLFVH